MAWRRPRLIYCKHHGGTLVTARGAVYGICWGCLKWEIKNVEVIAR